MYGLLLRHINTQQTIVVDGQHFLLCQVGKPCGPLHYAWISYELSKQLLSIDPSLNQEGVPAMAAKKTAKKAPKKDKDGDTDNSPAGEKSSGKMKAAKPCGTKGKKGK